MQFRWNDRGTVCGRIISVRRKRGPTEQLDVLGGWKGPRMCGGGENYRTFSFLTLGLRDVVV